MEIDRDNSGKISLIEFVESYFEQQKQVEERIIELNEMIEEDTEKLAEILKNLKIVSEAEVINKHGIMVGSVLTATIMEARDLKQTGAIG